MNTRIHVTATRWSGGWELAIDGEPVTQVRHLEDAAQQVRDYLDTDEPDTDHSGAIVEVQVDLGEGIDADLGERIESSRAAAREAQEQQVAAAKQVRTVVRTLRANDVSVADVATILGVSRGRVSQLAKESDDDGSADQPAPSLQPVQIRFVRNRVTANDRSKAVSAGASGHFVKHKSSAKSVRGQSSGRR